MYLGPLTFREVFKPKPWGGRALARVSGKCLPSGGRIGESWEVADHAHGMSVVGEGPLAGRTLRELMRRHGVRIVGRRTVKGRFPLLVKLLDVRERLSVQVHPDDDTARAMGLSDGGKTEAWYVIESRRHGRIAAGLRSRGVLSRLREMAVAGTLGEALETISPKRGEAWLCRAGTVHALGPGVVLLEIQQNSDATFRLYDWGRMGLDGKPRQLHVEESVGAVNGRALKLRPGRARTLRGMPFRATRLVGCDKFLVDRWRVGAECVRRKEGAFEILHVLGGSGMLHDGRWPGIELRRGRTVLVPACVDEYVITPGRALTMVRTAECG